MTNKLPMWVATYEFKVDNFDKEAKGVERKTKNLADRIWKNFTKNFKAVSTNLVKIGATMTAIGWIWLKFVKDSIDLAWKQEQAVAKVEAVYKATGGAVGRTFEQLKSQASELQSKTIFGDEDILENLTAPLLTFKSIQGDVFDRTQGLALDLSTTFGQDLKGSAIQLWKAIEDPVKWMSALNRVGVTFSEEQKKQIEQYQEQWKLVEAQTVLLDTLAGQVEWVAEAMANTFTWKVSQIQNSRGDLREAIGEAFTKNPEAIKFLDWIKTKIESVTEYIKNNPEIVLTLTKIAGALVAVGSVVGVIWWLWLALSSLTVFLWPAWRIALWITALIAWIIYLSANWDTIRVKLEMWVQQLQIKFYEFKQQMSDIWTGITARIWLAVQSVQMWFFNLKQSISDARTSITARIGLAIQAVQIRFFNLVSSAQNTRQSVVWFFNNLASWIWNAFARAGWFVQWLINKFVNFKSRVTGIIQSVKAKVDSFSLWNILWIAWSRATGWPVWWWSAYLVGERWPELFVPNSNGFVLPTPVTNSVLNNQKNFTVNVENQGGDPFRFGRQIGIGLSSSWI